MLVSFMDLRLERNYSSRTVQSYEDDLRQFEVYFTNLYVVDVDGYRRGHCSPMGDKSDGLV